MAVCPRCGGQKFHYELRSDGTRSNTNYYRTGVQRSWVLPAGQIKHQSHRKQKAVGICPECGYTAEKQETGCLFYLLCFIFWPITLSVWFYNTSLIRLKKGWKALILACIWIPLCFASGTAQSEASVDTGTDSASIWGMRDSELSDFDYYIDNDMIVLKSYKGRSLKVRIAPSYSVDGESMPVVALDGTFTLKTIDSVIIPEGVTRIVSNTFNSCGVKNLYLPSTLTDFSGWSYFHGVQKIYYGGTQEQWEALYNTDRSRLDVVRILYDVDIAALSS